MYELNPNGAVHGGLIAAAADQCMGIAACSVQADGPFVATASLTLDFHRPAVMPLRFEAVVTRSGRALAFVELTVRDRDGRVCTRCSGVWAVQPYGRRPAPEPLDRAPRKIEPVSPESTPGLRERSKQGRIDRIVTAALELLREDPERNLTIERLANRADVAAMTIFNLIGNREQLWAAMTDRALTDLDVAAIAAEDPQERARRIVDAVVKILCADAGVFGALLSGWGGYFPAHDPTGAFVSCLQDAADAGMLAPGVDVRRYGEAISAGLIGTIQLWAARRISDRAFRARARTMVDVVFAGACHGG
jgi:uncharacterized protein (TIGR00369 family)